jgi:error-prone DNA polymerase
MSYVELHAHSAFTFLEGASLPEQLAERAGNLGYEALAVTDRDDVGGAVRFVEATEKCGVRPIFGAELTVRATPMLDGSRDFAMGRDVFGLVLLAKDADGWANLSALISKGRFERPRGRPYVTIDEVAARSKGLVALSAFLDGPLAPALRARDLDEGLRLAKPWLDIFGDDFVFEVQDHTLPEERAATRTSLSIARALQRRAVATNHVHHVTPAIKPIEDVLRCIKHECSIDDAGDRLFPNDERYLKSAAEMRRRFRHHPELLRTSLEIAEQCAFHLKRDLRAPLPCFPQMGPNESADDALERLTWEGARVRYPYAFGPGSRVQSPGFEKDSGLWTLDPGQVEGRDASTGSPLVEKVHAQIRHELELVRRMQFAGYFLILYDVVRAARERKILVQGRGSAANSAICYCLGITAIDPIGREMLFERFLSEGRAEPPDIDVDIEHERREELLQYVYQRYGRDHAAMVAAVHTFQPRAAAKDVARVLGLSVDQGAALASLCDRFIGMEPWGGSHRTGAAAPVPAAGIDVRRNKEERAEFGNGTWRDDFMREHPRQTVTKALNRERERPGIQRTKEQTHENAPADGYVLRMDPDRLKDPEALRQAGLDPNDRRVAMVPWFVDRMVGLPRHRAIHTGGFVLSERPIGEVCPVEWASMPGRTILQWEKDDLSTLGLVKFDLLGLGMLTVIAKHLDLIEKHRGVRLDLWQLPHEDNDVFDMICKADTIGLFQIESRAQMNTLPRLQPRQFYDLVVEVALIRPGPIQGEMVHPYLRRRRGEEPVTYLHPDLEPHLARTLGVPLFQEQGMKIAIEVGGFSPTEADELRRAMAHKRSRKAMDELGQKLIERMTARGFDVSIAERIVKQLTAFADYGFPESHAASFALLVWASAYLKFHFTPEFTAAILNSQPMGFYSASTLVEDAKRHNVIVRGPCVMSSDWDCTLEPISPLTAPPHEVHPFAMRVGLRYVRGLGERTKPLISKAISPRPRSIVDFVRRSGLDEGQLLSLAHAGAFDALESERRRAIWEVMRLARLPAGPLDLPGLEVDAPKLPDQSEAELVAADFLRVGLTPRDHPMSFLRGELDARGVVAAGALAKCSRREVKVAGLVICRQRPATAKGFVFLTLEDEGGMVNIVVEPKLFDRQRRAIVSNAALEIEGELERQQDVINIKARNIRALSLPWAPGAKSHDFH